jgi:hypothetical protein
LHIAYDYFDKSTLSLNDEGSYADADARLEHKLHHEWTHNLDGIISSILDTGMRIQSFREYPFGMFQRFGWMVKNENGWWQSPDGKMKVPMLFSMQCSKLY